MKVSHHYLNLMVCVCVRACMHAWCVCACMYDSCSVGGGSSASPPPKKKKKFSSKMGSQKKEAILKQNGLPKQIGLTKSKMGKEYCYSNNFVQPSSAVAESVFSILQYFTTHLWTTTCTGTLSHVTSTTLLTNMKLQYAKRK